MVKFAEENENPEEKAAFNQARNIAEILSNLLGSYIVYMSSKNYKEAIETIKRIHDIISPKLQPTETKKIDDGLREIGKNIPAAMEIYIHNGASYIKDPELNRQVGEAIAEVFRFVNSLQDKYGYGMLSTADPRFAASQE